MPPVAETAMEPAVPPHVGGDPLSRCAAAMVDRVIKLVPALQPFQRIAETIARFAGVGGATSVLYGLVIIVAVSGLHFHHDVGAVLGYAIATPVNFLLHRHFTFRSMGHVQNDLGRYATLQGVNIVLSIGTMVLAVDGLGLPYGAGIVGAMVMIPVVTYFVMDRWVFKQRAA